MKQKQYTTRDFKISIVGYSDSPGVGYIRFAKNDAWGGDNYLGSIDTHEDVRKLRAIQNALVDLISQKLKPKKKKAAR